MRIRRITISESRNTAPSRNVWSEMKPGVTTEFEMTEFAGITTKIINPYPSSFTVLDMTVKPGFGAPAHISSTEDKLFLVIEGQIKYLIGDKTEIVGPGARVIAP